MIILMTNCKNQTNYSNQTVKNNQTNESEALAIGGGANTEFHDSFNTFSACIYDSLIKEEAFMEWMHYNAEIMNKYDPYVENIYEFIKYFDISRENFEEVYYSTNLYYLYDYDFDILYSGDVKKIYDYYSLKSEDPGHEYFYKKSTEESIKWDIAVKYLGSEKYTEWINKTGKSDQTFICWSIPEIIYAFDIPREDIEEIINFYINYEPDAKIHEILEDGSEKLVYGFGFYVFDYDLDKIYNEKDEVIKLIESGMKPYLIDESIRK